MEKSDEYIDYSAYVRFLVKVTGEHPDATALERTVLKNAVERSEMQTLWIILKKLALASAVVTICMLGAVILEILLK